MSSPVVRHPGELRWETRLLAVVTATLVALGIATVYGASSLVRSANGIAGGSYALTQFTGALVGGILMLVLGRIDYRLLRPLAWPLLLGSLLALVIVVLPFTPSFIAPRYNGARRWLRLGPLQFQVSELVRLVVIIWCAMLATKKGDQVRQFKKGMLPFLFILGVASALIMLQPNMSMAVLIALLGGIVLFSAGAKIGHFLLLGLGAVIAGLQLIQRAGYRAERWDKFINGAEGTSQIYQSLVGIGSGRLFGVGFGMGQQKMGYVPYAYSDFIFSAIAEEWGFVGCALVVSLYLVFFFRVLRVAGRCRDLCDTFLVVGIVSMLFFHVAINIGMVIGVFPVVGIPLPLFSYGGSSVLSTLSSLGIVLGVSMRRFMF